MKINRISATGLSGLFVNQEFELDIGDHFNNCKLKVNGKKITGVQAMYIKMVKGKFTKLTIEKIRESQ